MTCVRLCALALVFSVLCPAHAHAENARLYLLTSTGAPPVVKEATTRLRGELTAAGLLVVERTVDGANPARALRSALQEHDPTAQTAALLIVPASPQQIDLWAYDPTPDRTIAQSLHLPRGSSADAAALLSLRAFEVLRATSLVLVLEAAPPPVPPPAKQAPLQFFVTVAAAETTHISDARLALSPAVRIAYGGPAWALRVSLVAFGQSPAFDNTAGTAQVTQPHAFADVLRRFRTGHAVNPFVSCGIGALLVRVQGEGVAPWLGRTDSATSAFATAGSGVFVRATEHTFVTLEGTAFVHVAGARVRIGDDVVAQTRGLGGAVSLGVGAQF